MRHRRALGASRNLLKAFAALFSPRVAADDAHVCCLVAGRGAVAVAEAGARRPSARAVGARGRSFLARDPARRAGRAAFLQGAARERQSWLVPFIALVLLQKILLQTRVAVGLWLGRLFAPRRTLTRIYILIILEEAVHAARVFCGREPARGAFRARRVDRVGVGVALPVGAGGSVGEDHEEEEGEEDAEEERRRRQRQPRREGG